MQIFDCWALSRLRLNEELSMQMCEGVRRLIHDNLTFCKTLLCLPTILHEVGFGLQSHFPSVCAKRWVLKSAVRVRTVGLPFMLQVCLGRRWFQVSLGQQSIFVAMDRWKH